MLITSVFLFFCCFGISAGQNKKYFNNDKANCGKRNGSDAAKGLGVLETRAGEFPWHVGIYRYDGKTQSYEHVCGGTIISPHIVLTAASCVVNKDTQVYKTTLFRVAAGKLAVNWESADHTAQEVMVDEIAVPETYLGDLGNYADNVAVLNLADDLYFHELLSPICFNLNPSIYVINENSLQTAGWGLTGGDYNPFLREANFQYIDINECGRNISSFQIRALINYDKFCLLTPGGTKPHDAGGGLIYKIDNKYHLIGIMSAKINNDISVATNLSTHLGWLDTNITKFERDKRCKQRFRCLSGNKCIEESLLCDGTENCPEGTDEADEMCPPNQRENNATFSCSLPNLRGGVSYTKLICDKFKEDCEIKGGVHIAQNELVQLNCGIGFAPKAVGERHEYSCNRGSLSPEQPKCIKLCSPLVKTNVEFKCTYKGEVVNCTQYMREDTVATYNCSQRYRLVDPSAFRGYLTCNERGFWNEPIPNCIPECGIENPADSLELTISYGNVSKSGRYPWHIAIYKYLEANSSYVNICGGTLISEHMVLTASHCMFENNQKLMEEELLVAAGKFYRNFGKYEDHQQTSPVDNILTPDTYGGYLTHFEQDIAILNTRSNFIYSDYILPACIDYTSSLDSQATSIPGNMVGWGMTEMRVYSEELLEAHLQIIETDSCRRRNEEFISYITSDKFCILFRNGTGSQSGDSGGGLTLKTRDRHFVYGIVSLKKRDVNDFATMTNVSVYLEWIKRTLKTYSRQLN